MIEHEHDGRWVASGDEELWPCDVSFAAKEEAIAHARQEERRWVGRAQALMADVLMSDLFLERFAEFADQWLQDQEEFWREDGALVEVPPAGDKREWVREHLELAIKDMLVSWYRIVDVERVEDVK